jgi:hypothetical protein
MLGRIDQASADIAELEVHIEAEITPFQVAADRLDEITGVGRTAAQVIIAEVGVDMSRFPTPGHLVSWARFAPGVKESAGRRKGNATTGHGNPYLARVLGEAAVAAGRTNTFLGERYRRITRRRGAKRAIVAVGRSILIIVWHLLSDPTVRYQDLGPGFYDTRINAERRKRTTSANSKRSATRSPSNPLPDPTHHPRTRCLTPPITPPAPGAAQRSRVLPPAHSPSIFGLGRYGVRRGHVDDDAAVHGGLGSCQAWRDVVLKPGADQLGDAVQVLWLLVPQDADRPPVLGQDVLEATEPGVLCGSGQEVGAELVEQHVIDGQPQRHVDDRGVHAALLPSGVPPSAVQQALAAAEGFGCACRRGRGPTSLPP